LTTIQLDGPVKKELTGMKIHPHETYNEVVKRLLNITQQETSEELSSETIKNIEKSLQDIKYGRVTSHESIKKKFNLK